jgi:hypothetical protein
MIDPRELRRLIESWFPTANGEEINTLIELFVTAADSLGKENDTEE